MPNFKARVDSALKCTDHVKTRDANWFIHWEYAVHDSDHTT